jgi:hypothetical protein
MKNTPGRRLRRLVVRTVGAMALGGGVTAATMAFTGPAASVTLPAAPSGYVMATSGPPWACFAVYEVNLGVCVSDPLPNQLP